MKKEEILSICISKLKMIVRDIDNEDIISLRKVKSRINNIIEGHTHLADGRDDVISIGDAIKEMEEE